MAALLTLLLIAVPQPPQVPTVANASWSMDWGHGKGDITFHLSGEWTSETWRNGAWWAEGGIIYMQQGERLWGMRVIDWKAGTFDGWRCDGDSITDKVNVKIRQRIE